MRKLVRATRVATLIPTAAFAAVLPAMRAGAIGPNPIALAWLGGAVLVASAAALAVALARVAREREGRTARAAEAALFLGLALTAGAGLANWALGLQGVVVLTEGEAVSLDAGAHLEEVSAGPLARTSDLRGTVRLVAVDLQPTGDGFQPRSVLELASAGEGARRVAVSPAGGARMGAFVLHQGAFGFAPRLVVQKDGATVLDRTVPFTSRREGRAGVAFEAELELARHGVLVVAAVDLGDLDAQMKGHPVLLVEVRRGAEVLGQGSLLPGHGATIRDGWHIGYGGMKMWSEIDIRRGFGRAPALVGLGLLVAGALAWPILGWRRG